MSPSPVHLVASRAAPALRPDGQARPLLGALLQARGVLDAAQLSECLDKQSRQGARLGEIVRMELGLSEAGLQDALEDQWGAASLDLAATPPDRDLVASMGVRTCLRQATIPWRRIGAVTVIATADPGGFEARRADLEARFGTVMMALITDSALQESLAQLFGKDLSRLAEARVASADSCRGWSARRFQIWIAGLAMAAALMIGAAPTTAIGILSILAVLVLSAVNGLKFAAAWAQLRRDRPQGHRAQVIALGDGVQAGRRPVVSVLVPLYREQEIAGRLIRRLGALRYPPALLDLCLVVEADDAVTEAALRRAALPPWMRVIRVPHGALKTKPKAMNYALDFCRGSLIGIYDAEDAPDPDQIAMVVDRFATAGPKLACLQGQLAFYNARQNWMSRCFAIDYATWFSVVLPGLARLQMPVPLGGTTLFLRRAVLEEVGAWDAHNVTEDADLGIRLARRGYRTELIKTATGEEANCRIWPWIRQRSRWIKGYAMTYATHMRAPRRLWDDLGPRAFIGFQILFLGSLLQVVLAPVIWSWWLLTLGEWHPLAGLLSPLATGCVAGWFVAIEVGTITLGMIGARQTGQGWLGPWALTMNAYTMLGTLAAYKALIEMARAPFFWDKTSHGHGADSHADSLDDGQS